MINSNFLQSQKYIKTNLFEFKFIVFIKWILVFNMLLNTILNFLMSYYLTYILSMLFVLKINKLQIINWWIVENNNILFIFFSYFFLYIIYIIFFKIKLDLKTILIKKFKILWNFNYLVYFFIILIFWRLFFLFKLYELFYFKIYLLIYIVLFIVSFINIVFLHKLAVNIFLTNPIKLNTIFSFFRKKIYENIIFDKLEITNK